MRSTPGKVLEFYGDCKVAVLLTPYVHVVRHVSATALLSAYQLWQLVDLRGIVTLEVAYAVLNVNSALMSSCALVLSQLLLLTYSSVQSTSAVKVKN